MNHRIVHFEIAADDPAQLASFYTELFGWKIQKASIPGFDYWPCATGDGPGINGAITKRMVPDQAISNYVSVDHLDALLEKALVLGARVLVPKSPVPAMGWYALLCDPQGNPFGLWQSDPQARTAESTA